MILLLDTTTDYLGIGLWDNNKLHTKILKANTQNNKKIVSIIDKFVCDLGFEVCDLQAIGLINGPGGFTGIRTGITIANTLAYSLKIPIYSTDSLSAQVPVKTNRSVIQKEITSIISSAKEEVYYARFKGKILMSSIQIVPVKILNKELEEKYFIVGQIRDEQKNKISVKYKKATPKDRMKTLLQMIIDKKIISQKQARPLYIKKPNITIKK